MECIINHDEKLTCSWVKTVFSLGCSSLFGFSEVRVSRRLFLNEANSDTKWTKDCTAGGVEIAMQKVEQSLNIISCGYSTVVYNTVHINKR